MARCHGLGVLMNHFRSLCYYSFSARRCHPLIDWTGVGLIVLWSGKREGDSTKGPLQVFFGQGEYLQSKRLLIVLSLLFENHNDFVSVLRF
jgi:hypothetical protein